VFFDRADIRAMDDWEDRILRGLRHCKVMLAVLSPHYFDSAYCRKEWEVHTEHELDRAMPGEGIASIYIATAPGFESEAPAALDDWVANLRRRQYLDLRDWRTEGREALRREEVRRRLEALDQRLSEQFEKAERIANSPTTVPPHNRNFVGRIDELRRVREALALGRVGAIAAVHGLGGMGKSALAFEYAHAFAAEYPGGRFLVPAAGVNDLRIPIVNLAAQKGISLSDDERKHLDAAFARVRAAFEQGPLSLLLLDNLDDPKLLAPHHRAQCLPSANNVHVLVTTRFEPERLPGVECVALDALPESDALGLLEKHRAFADDAEREAARRVIRRLGGHPLAVEVVAVYLWQTPEVNYAGYAARLEREGLDALEGTARDDKVELSRHQQKLLSELLEPTLAGLSRQERLAIEYAALLPPDRIALPWLRALVGEKFRQVVASPERGYADPWGQIERRLIGLRMLSKGDDSLVRMHRLIQMVVTSRFLKRSRGTRQSELINHANSRGRELWAHWADPTTRWEIEPMRDFALSLADSAEGLRAPLPDWVQKGAREGLLLLHTVHFPLRELGRYEEARMLLRRALASKEGFDAQGLIEARLSTSLAEIEKRLGDFEAARSLLNHSIEIQEKAVEAGFGAWLLQDSYSNLGMLQLGMGNLAEAARFIRRAIEIAEKGRDVSDHVRGVLYQNLAVVEMTSGNLSEARRLLQHTISTIEKAFGVDHPYVNPPCHNLAGVEWKSGNLSDARQLFRRAIAILEKNAGVDHPNLAESYSKLALVERDLNNLTESRDLLRRAIAIRQKAFDRDHPDLGSAYNELSKVEWDLGHLAEARELMHQAHRIFQCKFGPEHSRTRSAAEWLMSHDPDSSDSAS
jgi:tetratricopeptide (TPR) repeat protein